MPYLGVFLVSGVYDGSAADFCDLLPPPVEGPHADLVGGRHVLDEEHPVAEPEAQLVEHLQVLQHVIVRGAGGKNDVTGGFTQKMTEYDTMLCFFS